jgi:D-aminopeptidase
MQSLRARDFGLKLGDMETGLLNAIQDVEGVGVGHCTLIEGESVRTGVTAIAPHQGNTFEKKVTAAVDLFNAYGKSVGIPQIIFEGVLESPILLTETLNVWRVADAALDYFHEKFDKKTRSYNPVVGETNGGYLTENFGRHIGKKEVFKALDEAFSKNGEVNVLEGNIGAGVPMTGYGFKGGIGTSSRVYMNCTVGVMVQLNCGRKEDLRIDGLPVGREVTLNEKIEPGFGNSIMMIVATDLKIGSRQLWKVAKRAALGLARTGSYGSNNSGDFTIAFSTGMKSTEVLGFSKSKKWQYDNILNPIYKATVEATEEAIVNALFMAETMKGVKGHVRYALPLDEVLEVFTKHNRQLN